MFVLERILFPVDFSPQSYAVAPFVRAMANRFGAQVQLLHVLESPPAAYGRAPLVGADISRFLKEYCASLGRFAAEELAGIPVQISVPVGDPALLISEYARDKHIGLIMLPTHGHGGFRRLLLGSVTAKVLHDTACPVWTAAHSTETGPRADVSWRRMLCAVEAARADLGLLRWAAEFVAGRSIELRLVHAVSDFEEQSDENGDDPLRDFLFEQARQRIAGLQSELATSLEVCVGAGSPSSVVRQIALSSDADLVLIGRGAMHKPLGRLRSNAYAIIREAPCPVISV